MDKTYIVPQFLIYESNDFTVIQNSKSTSIITDKQTSDFFLNIEKSRKNVFNYEELKKIFGINITKVLDFCIENNLIENYKESELGGNTFQIISNDKNFIKSCNYNLTNSKNQIIKYDEYDILNIPEIDLKAWVTIFLNPFKYEDYYRINKILANMNVVYRFAFYYEHNIFISNYYKQEWNNPCPLCFFANLVSTLKSNSYFLEVIPFQTILELIYEVNPGFKIETILTKDIILNIINLLNNTKKVENNFDVNKTYMYDYKNNIIMEDRSLFWDLCDCYE